MIFFVSVCNAQKSKLNYKKINENVQSQKLEEFLTSDLKVDTVSNLQYACFFIKVYNNSRIDFLTSTGELDKKFRNIIEYNINKKNVPWLKKNKGTTMWYVLPVIFGHINPNLSERQIYKYILADEVNLLAIRELIRDFPNKVFILNTFRKLRNEGMQDVRL